jgi:hypothetical protein
VFRRHDENATLEPEAAGAAARLADLADELGRLRKTVLRQGHAQELFQARVEAAVGRLAAASGPARPPAPGEPAAGRPAVAPSAIQVRALLELDQAVLQLLRVAAGAEAPGEDAPASLREGLSLLQVRVRNLAHSMGLAPIPAVGRPFDDQRHQVEAVVERDDLPDDRVVEEVLPGYVLGDRVVRPSRVVVNRRHQESP